MMVANQFKGSVQSVCSDNGSKFTNALLRDFFKEKGILFETSCVYTPQQNGRVKRKNRHILNAAIALRFQSSSPV